MSKQYFIKATLWGKTYYWSQHHGLHSGRGKLKGHSVYKTLRQCNNAIKLMKKLFSSQMKFFAITQDELPFIKKQINANKRLPKRGHTNKLTKTNS